MPELEWILFYILLNFASLHQCCSYRFCRDVLGCRDNDEATSGARFEIQFVLLLNYQINYLILKGCMMCVCVCVSVPDLRRD